MSIDGDRDHIAALRSELLRRRLAERGLTDPASDAREPRRTGEFPLSAGQRRMWSLQQLDPASTGYNIRIALDLCGPLDADKLIAAVARVVKRHDVLRSTYRPGPDGEAVQVVHSDLPHVVERHDLSDLPADQRERRVDWLCRDLAARPFDLAVDSPLRVGLVRTAADAATLMVVAHHIAWDDGTSAIFFGELMAYYRDPAVQLPPAMQYIAASADTSTDGLDHWRRALSPLPEPLALPLLGGTGGVDQSFALRPGTAGRVRDLARTRGTSTFMVLVAVVGALLHRYTGSRDFLLGAPVINRDVPGGDEVIGYLGNTIPIRVRVEPDDDFGALLERVKRTCVTAYAHQDVDLDDIARAVDPDRTRAADGLFNVVLSLRTEVLGPFRDAGFTVRRRHVPGDDARFDLTLAVETDGEDMTVEANHPASDPAQDLVAGLLEHLDLLLAAVLTDPGRPLRDHELLTPGQRDRLLTEWNDTAAPAEERLLPELFAARVAAHPDAPAVISDGARASYAELDRRADLIAGLLVEHGVAPESVVALAVPRSVDMVAAVLAVARAGAAYAPIDPDHPADRVRLMLADSRPSLMLTTADIARRLETPADLKVILLDGPMASSGTRPVAVHPDNPAYVIYTSGSTGVPKGVVVTHRALSNHLAWSAERFAGLAGHTLMHSSISFDFSITPLLATLTCGGVLELCVDSPDAIARATGAATFLKITPSHLPLLPSVRFAEHGPRTLVIAGEALHGEALAQWSPPTSGRIDVINEYGPTETTVGCLLHTVEGGVPPGPIPVGLPVANTTCHVLDDALRLVPVGVAGELYVGGVQVARGYLNRPGLTASRFVADPFGPPGARLYRTGDRVRRLPSGALEFLGRTDDQLKIRGFRVEPGEIESILLTHPDVAQASVAARSDGPGGSYLVGYAVPVAGASPDPAALLAHLAAALPEHMVPATVMVLDALPLSPSGKVDRQALPAPALNADGPVREPANDVERTLASLFAEVLGRDSVRLDASFFELGGDSIVSIRLVSRARRAGLTITPRDVFAHKTVERLAEVATAERAGPSSPSGDIGGTGDVDLTPIMRSFAERGPLGDRHRMSVLVDVPADLEPERLTRAVQAVVDRHDALRARLVRDATGPRLSFGAVGSVSADTVLRRVETGTLVVAELEAAVGRLAPADGVVLQVVWFDAGHGNPSKLLLVAHHLVVDGVSWRVLVEDLAAAWHHAAGALPPVPTSFRAWARGLVERAADRTTELPVWRAVLDGPDPLLGARLPDPARDTWSSVRTATVRLDPAVTDAVLTTVPAAFFAGVDDVLLTALAMAVGDLGARSFLVLKEGHGRQEAAVPGTDLSRTVGWFTSQHPVRLDTTGAELGEAFAGGPAAGALVKRTKEHLRSLPDHGIGFGMLRYLHAATAAELAALPVPQIGFNYLGRFDSAGADGWRFGASALDAAYDDDMPLPAGLVVNAVTEESADGPSLTAYWMYAEGVFTEADVAALAGRWTAAVHALIQHASGDHAGGRTPSDVPLVNLDQGQLDALEAKWRKA